MQREKDAPFGFFISEKHWVGLWDFGWIEVASYFYKNYESLEYNSKEILKSFIGNRFYQVTETVTEGLKPKPIETHGPYLIKNIMADDFAPISYKEFLEKINHHFLDEPKFTKPPTKEQLASAKHLIDGLDINTSEFFMLNKSFRREVGIFHSIFYEYVIINPTEERLHICVIAYD